MALKRVTIQDIADACGLSRNTVSKVFNNRGAVPESTRKLVMQKAQALGYGMFSEEDPSPARDGRVNIALLTQPKLLSHSFGAYFLTSFTDQVSRSGYNLKIYEISPREIAEKRLPPHLLLEETAGFLGIELFDREYQAMICSLGIPCVFVDGHARLVGSLLSCDCISMENVAASAALTVVIEFGKSAAGALLVLFAQNIFVGGRFIGIQIIVDRGIDEEVGVFHAFLVLFLEDGEAFLRGRNHVFRLRDLAFRGLIGGLEPLADQLVEFLFDLVLFGAARGLEILLAKLHRRFVFVFLLAGNKIA